MRDGGRSAGERTSRKGEMTKKSVSTTWCVASGTRPSPAAACVMKPYAEILPRIRVSTGSANTRKERAETRGDAAAGAPSPLLENAKAGGHQKNGI